MTREEATKNLLTYAEKVKYLSDEDGALGACITIALKSPWIPVTERQPEYEQVVIAAYGSRNYICFNHRTKVKIVRKDRQGWCFIGYRTKVTHWMPIPQLPEDLK